MNQHLENKERSCMTSEYVLFNDTFNKSAILDIENMLIEHMNADTVFNSKDGKYYIIVGVGLLHIH